MSALCNYELECWQKNQLLLGVDEAGRGPLAGPLVVCGVILSPNCNYDFFDDSKKISEKKRFKLLPLVYQNSLVVDVEVVDVLEIDSLNIYQATKLAMTRIIKRNVNADLVITDAMPIDDKRVLSLVKGDQKSVSVAAASIVAKCVRDLLMDELNLKYPDYQFSKHKGYPTKLHYELIKKYGITPCHRRSYKLIK